MRRLLPSVPTSGGKGKAPTVKAFLESAMRSKTQGLVFALFGLLLAAVPVLAHHSVTAEFDPKKSFTVTGTLKKGPTPEGRTEYYFIAKKDREAYYEFCKALFTKGQAGSLETKLEVVQAAAAH